MRRVFTVLLIATLTTMMIGIDRTSWASQDRDHQKREKQRAAVTKALGEMTRGSTATIERQDGQKIDVVIQEITPDAVTVMRQQQDHVVTETIRQQRYLACDRNAPTLGFSGFRSQLRTQSAGSLFEIGARERQIHFATCSAR